jgi:glycosyltransferase involved in cell wall biosynthesis
MIQGERILCFAPDPWSDIWRNRHRLLGVLARSNRILYVEPRLGIRQLGRKLRAGEVRPRHFFRRRVEEVRPNLFVYHDPLHLPRTALRGAGPLVERARDRLLRGALERLEMSRPILWIVRPDGHDLPGKFGEKLVLYQIVDDYSQYAGMSPRARARLEQEEQALASKADVVIVTSERLLELKRNLHPGVILVRNAVDAATLEEGAKPDGPVPRLVAAASRPVHGYVGGITDKLDLELLAEAASAMEASGEGTLVLVGPVNVSPGDGARLMERLRASPRVVFTGPRPAAEIPSFIRGFDVCWIPYRTGEQARAIDPLKLYEYLAFGKPTVSVEIPSILPLEGLVRVARSRAEFLAHARDAARENDPALAERRRAMALENSWEDRVERISTAIEESLRARDANRVR